MEHSDNKLYDFTNIYHYEKIIADFFDELISCLSNEPLRDLHKSYNIKHTSQVNLLDAEEITATLQLMTAGPHTSEEKDQIHEIDEKIRSNPNIKKDIDMFFSMIRKSRNMINILPTEEEKMEEIEKLVKQNVLTKSNKKETYHFGGYDAFTHIITHYDDVSTYKIYSRYRARYPDFFSINHDDGSYTRREISDGYMRKNQMISLIDEYTHSELDDTQDSPWNTKFYKNTQLIECADDYQATEIVMLDNKTLILIYTNFAESTEHINLNLNQTIEIESSVTGGNGVLINSRNDTLYCAIYTQGKTLPCKIYKNQINIIDTHHGYPSDNVQKMELTEDGTGCMCFYAGQNTPIKIQ